MAKRGWIISARGITGIGLGGSLLPIGQQRLLLFPKYRQQRLHYSKTRPTPVAIGERRRPTEEQVAELDSRLQHLVCIDPQAGDGLFTFVLLGEPEHQRAHYAKHLASCEYCRTASELYRYKRDAAKVFSKWARAKEIVARAQMPDSRVLKKQVGNNTAYFQPGDGDGSGTTVLVDSTGGFLSVEQQSREEFESL